MTVTSNTNKQTNKQILQYGLENDKIFMIPRPPAHSFHSDKLAAKLASSFLHVRIYHKARRVKLSAMIFTMMYHKIIWVSCA